MAAGYEPPRGWTVLAFSFALDTSPEQLQVFAPAVRRQAEGM